MELFKQIENKGNIFLELNSKFAGNLSLAFGDSDALWLKAEQRARAIPAVATVLSTHSTPTRSQLQLLCIYDEIFADIICSVYLAGSALDKPAQMVLRRALEMGVAAVYLWDLPHVFWAWRNHDKDLNFNEMLEYLASPGYRSFVEFENADHGAGELLNNVGARVAYRNLSNIVHGKIMSFESTLPDRFQHNADDWKIHLVRIIEVETLLIDLWRNRFACVRNQLPVLMPQIDLA